MEIPIIYEDEAFAAINKPTGIAVNKSENETGETIQDWSQNRFGIITVKGESEEVNKDVSDFFNRAGIVHRLDKETSGLLLIAKKEEVFLALQKLFLERSVKKTYVSLVHGLIGQGIQTINAPVGRLPWNRRKFGVIPDGRPAETEIEVKNHYSRLQEKYTLIEARPKTGRTHQIRIHLKHMGQPVVSDFLYAGRKVYREDVKFCPRLFLHAKSLSFMNPLTGQKMELNAPLPDDLKQTLQFLTPVG